MIQSVPNPPMGFEDVARFIAIVSKSFKGNHTPEERARIEARKKEMKRISEIVKKNNGGKDPILGY